jgi:hypothetical protein
MPVLQGCFWWLSLLFSCKFLVVHISTTRTEVLTIYHPPQPHVSGRHDRVVPSAPKGSFMILLSPPQCHAAFGTMTHTLASVDQSPVLCPRTSRPTATRMPGVGFWRIVKCLPLNFLSHVSWLTRVPNVLASHYHTYKPL